MDRDKLKEKIREKIGIEMCSTCSDSGLCLKDNNYCSCAEEAELALTAIESAGYILMPKDPTSEMIAKVHWLGETSVREVYAALMAGVKFKEPSDG